MIFITVGMSEFPFNRLLEWVDDLCRKMTITEEVFAQTGHSTYRPKYYKSEAFLTREENIKVMENAKIIVTHAGAGSVVSALKLNKKVIVFPRLSELGEHTDNHQLELSQIFGESEYVLTVDSYDSLVLAFERVEKFMPNVFQSNNLDFVRRLDEYLIT